MSLLIVLNILYSRHYFVLNYVANSIVSSVSLVVSETHKGIETCSTVPCSEIFKANLHILSTIFGHPNLNSKWPLCYKTNLSWNIAYFIEVLGEV